MGPSIWLPLSAWMKKVEFFSLRGVYKGLKIWYNIQVISKIGVSYGIRS